MDYLSILKDHLGFIERFYKAAAEPFETSLRKIEAEEEPFVPKCAPGDHNGPGYLSEWIEADECLGVVGSCSLGLLQKVLHDYLLEFVKREGGPGPRGPANEQWFDQHCRFLEEKTAFRWANSPVPKGQIEQLNLSRNDFAHNSIIGTAWSCQSEEHFRKYPASAFADKLHLAALTGESGTPECSVFLKVTRENLTTHIEYVRQFCTFVDAQRTKW